MYSSLTPPKHRLDALCEVQCVNALVTVCAAQLLTSNCYAVHCHADSETDRDERAPVIAGLYHSAEGVSSDTCLYIENFAYRVANSSHLNATTKAQVTLGFDYYLGLDGNTTAEDIAAEVR